MSQVSKMIGFQAGPAKKITAGIRPSALKLPTSPVTDVTKKAIRTTSEMSPQARSATAHVTERNYAKIPDLAPSVPAPKVKATEGFLAKLFR